MLAISIISNFAGAVYPEFLARMTLGAETLNAGLMAIHNNVIYEKALPRLTSTGLVQTHAATPVSAGSLP